MPRLVNRKSIYFCPFLSFRSLTFAPFPFFYLQNHSKIVELEEELRVVGNNLKSLEVSEEKVRVVPVLR